MTIPVLEYHNQTDEGPIRRRWLRAIFFVIALLAITSIFLPFTYGISPWEVARHMIYDFRADDTTLFLLGMPFFFAVPLTLWNLRLLIGSRGTLVEWILSWIMFALAALMSATVAVQCLSQYLEDSPPRDPEMFLGLIGIAIHLAWAIGGFWLFWRRTRSPDALASSALIGSVLSNAVMCLILFRDGPDIGWWFTLIAAGGLFAELVVTLALGRRGF